MCNDARGFTLVEIVIAIVIIGVGTAGLLVAFNTAVQSSADPLIRKQLLAVAEETLEEALLKPFSPSGAPPGNTAVNCGTAAASRKEFDDVSDYHNYETNGICDIEGTAVAGLGDYHLKVTVDGTASIGGLGSGLVKRVTVTVTRGPESITLNGWRTNYGS